MPAFCRRTLLSLTVIFGICLLSISGRPSLAEEGAKWAEGDEILAAAAHPAAVKAGFAVLEEGGTAVDAAIAMQAVLSLVEPQSSGIGGGGFLLFFDRKSGRVTAFDGRETAPRAVDETLFLGPDGKPMAFMDAALGGRAVGVPGVMRMLALAHRRHGRLAWARLFAPAIRLAEEGFPISPRLHAVLARHAAFFRKRGITSPEQLGAAGPYFFTKGNGAKGLQPKPVGTILKNPAYARTLRVLADQGVDAFYTGSIARDIVRAVRENPFSPGKMTLADLAAYEAEAEPPLCGRYRVYRLCAMGPPSSGGSTMLAILGILEGFDLARMRPWGPKAVHLYAEASRLAYADRDRYTADARFYPVPLPGLIDRDYLARRRQLIHLDRAMETVAPGHPPGAQDAGVGRGPDHPSTSHLVAIDREGNAVTFTTTVQIAFGSFVMVDGFLLNNQLTDFDFNPRDAQGRPVANRPEGGKKPRSSMTPTFVFGPQGRLVMGIGSPGGSRIISYVTKTVIGVLDWKMPIEQAIAAPNLLGRGDSLTIEKGSALEALASALEAMGHRIRRAEMTSGLHGFTVRYDANGRPHYRGGADPRREGIVLAR